VALASIGSLSPDRGRAHVESLDFDLEVTAADGGAFSMEPSWR
jgi:hypothetical protein